MWRKLATLSMSLLIPFCAACGAGAGDEPARAEAARPAPEARPATAPATAPSQPAPASAPLVVFLGDSLTAGLGLEADQAYPARIDALLAAQGEPVRVLNAGVSGDTTAGGLSRLSWLLKQKPDVLVVGLGANDGLRGLPLAEIEKNLREILRRGQDGGAKVLLLGMQIPPNYGDYARDFAAIYPRIAKDLDVPLVPFLLEGVGGEVRLNQADGIHPTAEGHEILAKTVLPYVEPLVKEEVEERAAVAGKS